MEILSPASYLSSYNWLLEESRSSTKWTPAENKTFENALAVHDRDTPDRWQKVAALIPGKTVRDVMKQYKELEDDVSSIEAGLVPIPGYSSNSPFTLDWGNTTHGFVEGFRQPYGGGSGGRRSSAGRNSEHERKKGVPWTEEEHKLFLMGLKKYGKGDWRNISRNFVITRTPTQVASHAQKYFIRQLSGGKDKRRASIHDITTLNLNDNHQTPSPDTQRPISPPERSSSAPIPITDFQWNQLNIGAEMAVHPTHGNLFMSPNCGIDSYGMKMQAESMRRITMPRGAYGGAENMVFQMESVGRYPHG